MKSRNAQQNGRVFIQSELFCSERMAQFAPSQNISAFIIELRATLTFIRNALFVNV